MEQKQVNLQTVTGEELAQFLNQEYQLFMQAQNNIRMISAELDRRNQVKKSEKKDEKS